jgi:hypothetical protein
MCVSIHKNFSSRPVVLDLKYYICCYVKKMEIRNLFGQKKIRDTTTWFGRLSVMWINRNICLNPVINPTPSIVTLYTRENMKETSDAVRGCYIMLTDLVLETAQESSGHFCVWKHCTAHFRIACSNRKLALTVNRFLRKEVSRKPMRISRS